MTPTATSAADASGPRVAIVILNWNGWRETIRAIESVFAQGYRNCTLVVLDNGSTDASAEQLRCWLDEHDAAAPVAGETMMAATSCVVVARGARSILLKSATNQGFAGGSNIAIAYALQALEPDFVFLLNSDATMDPQCLQRCVGLARGHADAAIVGAIVKQRGGSALLFAGAEPLRELFVLSAPVREPELPETWETGRAEGSAQLLDAGFLRAVHARHGYYLDPRLFMYCEDLDLALEARLLGRKTLMTRLAVIRHGVAGSSGGSGNPLQHYYITRNRIFLARRWLSPPQRVLFHAWYAPSRIVRVAQRFLQGKPKVAAAIWQGLKDGYTGRSGKWRLHDDRRSTPWPGGH